MPGASSRFLFVYGLLRSDVGGPMQPALAKASRLVGSARWRGRLYLVADYPGAVPSDEDGEWVEGELYELPEPAERLLARLDAYEGVPCDYRRVVSGVHTRNGLVEAWVYVWDRPTDSLERIESGDFVNRTV